MGGTYWYYYILDGNFETFDESQPITSTCPLLPGQTVNVLDVPLEKIEEPSRRASASAITTISEIHTLKPNDRYQRPRPDPNPKFSRLSTSPPELQKGHNEDRTHLDRLLDARKKNIASVVPTPQYISTKPPTSSKERSRTPDIQPSTTAHGLSDFDFNNFELDAYQSDDSTSSLDEELGEYIITDPQDRPRSDGYHHLSWSTKARHNHQDSVCSIRSNSAPAVPSLLESHLSSDVTQMQHMIREFQLDTHEPHTFHSEHAKSWIEDECQPNEQYLESWALGSDQWSYPGRPSMNKDISTSPSLEEHRYPEEPDLSFHLPESLDTEQTGLEFVHSPTCGSLTEDISDESFVTSSASSDIWSPHAQQPLRLHSPSLEYRLDRPSSSASEELQTDLGRHDNGAFHGYSLSEEAGESQLTLTKTITPKATPHLRSGPPDGWISSEELRASMPSLPTLPSLPKMDSLLDDLGYLGGVIS
ncbi:MAG: hypothetical protein M1821_010039 [Bathelium mastoideum]|nr:MAG: hypothetical protein M1821_010039 [Bathelium mastoideum]